MTRFPATTVFLALALAAPAAQAGRPLVTDDADVLDRGACELEGFGARSEEPAAAPARRASVQVGCGVGSRSQLALSAGRAWQAGDTVTGWGLGGKTGLVGPEAGRPGVAVGWFVDAQRPAGGPSRHDASGAALLGSWGDDGPWTGHANLGWVRAASTGTDTTLWGLAVEHAVRDGLDLVAELYGTDRTRPWAGVGLRWALHPRVGVDASWATALHDRGTRDITVGATLAF